MCVTAGDIDLYAQHIDRPFLRSSGTRTASEPAAR